MLFECSVQNWIITKYGHGHKHAHLRCIKNKERKKEEENGTLDDLTEKYQEPNFHERIIQLLMLLFTT